MSKPKHLLYTFLSKYFNEIIEAGPKVNTKLEVSFLNKVFSKYKVKKVLDVACGTGRHSVPLAELGYNVTGLDYSAQQLKVARKKAKKRKVKIEFIKKDANKTKFQGEFDGAMVMWTTLGEKPLNYKKVIRNIFEALKKGGIFVIDNNSWLYIPKNKKESLEYSSDIDGKKLKVEINDEFKNKLRIRMVNYTINGRIYQEKIPVITRTLKTKEWIKELKGNGFEIKETFFDYKNKRNKKGQPHRVQLVAQKPYEKGIR